MMIFQNVKAPILVVDFIPVAAERREREEASEHRRGFGARLKAWVG